VCFSFSNSISLVKSFPKIINFFIFPGKSRSEILRSNISFSLPGLEYVPTFLMSPFFFLNLFNIFLERYKSSKQFVSNKFSSSLLKSSNPKGLVYSILPFSSQIIKISSVF